MRVKMNNGMNLKEVTTEIWEDVEQARRGDEGARI
jgi:hypothetical protein